MLFLLPEEVLNWGFRHFNGLPTYYKGGYTQKSIALFKKFYGSSPAVIANMWYNLQEKIDVVPPNMKTEKGFKKILIAIHFLWVYPKNG